MKRVKGFTDNFVKYLILFYRKYRTVWSEKKVFSFETRGNRKWLKYMKHIFTVEFNVILFRRDTFVCNNEESPPRLSFVAWFFHFKVWCESLIHPVLASRRWRRTDLYMYFQPVSIRFATGIQSKQFKMIIAHAILFDTYINAVEWYIDSSIIKGKSQSSLSPQTIFNASLIVLSDVKFCY